MRTCWYCPSIGLLVLLAVGCAAGPPSAGPVADSRPPGSTQDPDAPPKVLHRLENPAVVALWQQAERERAAQRYDQAAHAIERALRIDPGDAALWSRLAELRLEGGQPVQAENLAAKSNALAADNPVLRYRNWLIIGAARAQRQDAQGVREAQRESERLKRLLPP